MARNRTSTPAPAPADAPGTTDHEETPVTDTATDTPTPAETPDTEGTGTDTPGTDTPDAPKVDTFAVFTAAFDTALNAAAEADGTTDDIAAPVVTAYRALKGKARDKAAGHVAEIMSAKITAGDLGALTHVAALQQAYTAPAATPAKVTTPTDPREAFLAKVTPLMAAVRIVTDAAVASGLDVSEIDTDTPAEGLVKIVTDWMADETADKAPLTGDAAVAHKIVSGKAPGTKRTGTTRPAGAPRGDVGAHITSVLDAAPDGAVLSVADIVREGSDGYAPGTVSQGAVTNRIKSGMEGYTSLGGPAKMGGVEGPLSIRKN